MVTINDIVYLIELHDAEGIRNCFASGISPNEKFRGQPLFYELISEYTRSSRFKDCVKAFLDYGLVWEDLLLPVLLSDDVEQLAGLVEQDPGILNRKYSLRTAYTPTFKAGLLHICAEFNLTESAQYLIKNGVSVNEPAGLDLYGFGGQTPIFHTVNQNRNQSAEMLHLLLSNNADVLYTIKGLIWGKSYEWETLIPSVNPVSYAMMGILPQMHRSEKNIAETVSLLLKHAYGIDYTPENIPNKYLQKR